MSELRIKIKTILSFIEKTQNVRAKYQEFSNGGGQIIVYGDYEDERAIVSWRDKEDRDEQFINYIFLGK